MAATYFKDIRAAIKKLIDDNADTIQEVYSYERSTFGGFPAVVIAPSDNEAEYGSTTNDKLTFVFKIKIYNEVAKEAEHEEAEEVMEGAVDELLSLFLGRGVLGSACEWVTPVPGTWYYEERANGLYRVAELTIKCVKHISHTV